MKRYMTLGFAVVLALSLAVPALGGPSNPVASSAVSLTGVLKKAKKAKQAAAAAQATADNALSKANAAQSSANGAQSSANSAQSTANSAQTAAGAAQTTANSALAEAADVSANDLNVSIESETTANNSTSPKTISASCPAGKEVIAGWGDLNTIFFNAPPEVRFMGTFWYGNSFAYADEIAATAASWNLTAQATCIRSSG
jgi:hypothetical protein